MYFTDRGIEELGERRGEDEGRPYPPAGCGTGIAGPWSAGPEACMAQSRARALMIPLPCQLSGWVPRIGLRAWFLAGRQMGDAQAGLCERFQAVRGDPCPHLGQRALH